MAPSRWPRLALLTVTVVLVVNCGDDEPQTGAGDRAFINVIVRPNRSLVGTRYWVFHSGNLEWEEVESPEEFPPTGKVQTVVTTRTDLIRNPAEATGPSIAMADSTVVALFTGGLNPQGGPATRAAVLYVAGEDPITELEMVQARIEHSMTRLPDERILIVGGYSPTLPVASAEIFSLSSAGFAATGSMRLGRGSHAAAPLGDGRVLVTGGLVLDGAGPATIDDSTTEIFDPVTGTFDDGPDMLERRFNHSAVALNDGRVLVLGGNHRRSAEIFDPDSGKFLPLEDMAAVHGNGHQAIKLASGKVLIIGGDANTIEPTAVCELFDPATDEFTTVGPMSIARMQHFAVLLEDGRVIVGGGRGPDGSDLGTAEIFSPVTNGFTPAPDLPGTTSEQPGALVITPKAGS